MMKKRQQVQLIFALLQAPPQRCHLQLCLAVPTELSPGLLLCRWLPGCLLQLVVRLHSGPGQRQLPLLHLQTRLQHFSVGLQKTHPTHIPDCVFPWFLQLHMNSVGSLVGQRMTLRNKEGRQLKNEAALQALQINTGV